MHKERPEYITFPVSLLSGSGSGKCIKQKCEEILKYVFYKHSLSLSQGTDMYKYKAAARFYGYSGKISEGTLSRLKQMEHGRSVVSIRLEILEDFRTSIKTDFEVACLLAFCAIRSILGKKAFCKTVNLFLLSRMAGEDKQIAIERLPAHILHYSSEYQLNKIKNELKLNWGLKYYSRYTRGFYVSFKLDMKSLIKEAEKRRKSYQEKILKGEQERALKEVLSELFSDTTIARA